VSTVSHKVEDQERLQRGMQWVFDMASKGLQSGPVVITLGRESRSLDQNNKLWPMLTDVSKQVDWYGKKHSKEDWKDIISSAWLQQTLVPGINGGFVAIGVRTSKLTPEQFSGLIECIYAFGAEQGVKWSEPALQAYEQYRQPQQREQQGEQ